MRVGSSSDIYQLIAPKAKPRDRSEMVEGPSPRLALTGTTTSLGADAAAAALQAKLAESGFNRSDANGDGIVTREEYVSEASRQKPGQMLEANPEDIEKAWDKLDKGGKGQLTEQEYAEAFDSVFHVSRGTFTQPIR